mmetsp:Transcript_63238/g.152658  ORF Transcript_63238/g.152658 Transcript_63238/m.152658 type:complete len:241 (+) Transcript_63238:292-1014(+)
MRRRGAQGLEESSGFAQRAPCQLQVIVVHERETQQAAQPHRARAERAPPLWPQWLEADETQQLGSVKREGAAGALERRALDHRTTAAAAAAADPADASAQEGMLERRQALADTFVRNMRSDGAAAAAKAAAEADEDEDEDDEDDGFEDAVGETSELGVPLLVTTELAARGVDFKAIDVVFMLGLPTRLDSYVHVAGRTAREGRKGHAISLLTSPQQEERFAQYKSELGLKAEVIDLRFLS